jgi:hypothetical protein
VTTGFTHAPARRQQVVAVGAERVAPGSPLFIIGAPFSGATVLAWALGQHPTLVPVVEDPAVSFLEALRVLDEDILPVLARDVLEPIRSVLGCAVQAGRPAAEPDDLGLQVAAPPGARTPRGVIAGDEVAARIAAARELFPELRLVHVHRRADAVVAHLRAAAARDGFTLAAHEAHSIWERTVRECVEAERLVGPDRFVRLSYNRLAGDPEGAVDECLWLLGERRYADCLWPLRLLTTHTRGEQDEDGELPAPRHTGASPRMSKSGGAPVYRRLRRLVETVVPAGASVLVVSRGDDELVRLRGRDGRHFPQLDDGTWAGHYPADGEAALDHLLTLAAAGASHLLVPRPAFWWLDHYPELRRYLECEARLAACDAELGVVWELTSGMRLSLPTSLSARPRTPREPANASAFRIERRTPPSRRPQALGGSLWGVTTFYNPAGYTTKAANYARFRHGLTEAGVPLLTVELAFGEAPFELKSGDADRLIQLRSPDVLWQKERLLNLGIRALPEDCDKVAWLDADLLFARSDWAAETSRLLQRYVAVQPFSHCVRLPPGAEASEPAMLRFGSGEGDLFYGIAWGVYAKGRRSLSRYEDHGHTGFAWAARRRLLEDCGLYDANLLGNGDTDIAHAMFGSSQYWGLRKVGDQARIHLRRWAVPFATAVAGSVAHVDGVVSHLWHGSPQHRLYDKPLDVLHDFDPEHDLELDPRTGLYRWAGAAPASLRAWSRDYFAARREDG